MTEKLLRQMEAEINRLRLELEKKDEALRNGKQLARKLYKQALKERGAWTGSEPNYPARLDIVLRELQKLIDALSLTKGDEEVEQENLQAENQRLQDEINRKDEALKFYSDRSSYERDADGRLPIADDVGRKAYDALLPATEGGK